MQRRFRHLRTLKCAFRRLRGVGAGPPPVPLPRAGPLHGAIGAPGRPGSRGGSRRRCHGGFSVSLAPKPPLFRRGGSAAPAARGGEAPAVNVGMGDWLSQGHEHFCGIRGCSCLHTFWGGVARRSRPTLRLPCSGGTKGLQMSLRRGYKYFLICLFLPSRRRDEHSLCCGYVLGRFRCHSVPVATRSNPDCTGSPAFGQRTGSRAGRR
jgi:hypothetical protein